MKIIGSIYRSDSNALEMNQMLSIFLFMNLYIFSSGFAENAAQP